MIGVRSRSLAALAAPAGAARPARGCGGGRAAHGGTDTSRGRRHGRVEAATVPRTPGCPVPHLQTKPGERLSKRCHELAQHMAPIAESETLSRLIGQRNFGQARGATTRAGASTRARCLFARWAGAAAPARPSTTCSPPPPPLGTPGTSSCRSAASGAAAATVPPSRCPPRPDPPSACARGSGPT